MRYKVEGVYTPDTDGTHVMETRQSTISKWYSAESPLSAAGAFVLEYPEVNNEPILVVNEAYDMANFPLETAKWAADHLVGLRG